MQWYIKYTAGLFAVVLISACGEQVSSSAAGAETASRQWVPEDSALAEVYGRSCRSCHTIAATGAPLTGDADAWRPRMAKGINVLVDNVVSGYGGMPPFGLCMDCDADQLEALTRFMAAPGGSGDGQ